MEKIFTKRLVLRNWELADAESMYKYAKDPDVALICGFPPHDKIEVSQGIVKRFSKKPYNFAICLKEDLENPIGCIELMMHPTDLALMDSEVELGYWLGKPYWENGYMTEAASALIDYGFTHLNIDTIWCGYYKGNEKSKRVQEKLGFIYHHTNENSKVELLNEVRTNIANRLTKKMWENLKK